MAEREIERKLVAVLYADVVGYSRLMGEDEADTHKTVSAFLDSFAAAIEGHKGAVVHYAGDAVLAEFQSVIAAVTCAVDIQRDIAAQNAGISQERQVLFRIGVNLGEVIVARDDIFGDGVNVAARLEGLAEPGGICVSASVHQQVKGKIDVTFEDMGDQRVKNIAEPVRTYRVVVKQDEAAAATSGTNTSSASTT